MTHDIPEVAEETTETTKAAEESRAGSPGVPERATVEADVDAALLGGPRALTVEGLAERAGLTEKQVRSYWQALGLPITEEQEQYDIRKKISKLNDYE